MDRPQCDQTSALRVCFFLTEPRNKRNHHLAAEQTAQIEIQDEERRGDQGGVPAALAHLAQRSGAAAGGHRAGEKGVVLRGGRGVWPQGQVLIELAGSGEVAR